MSGERATDLPAPSEAPAIGARSHPYLAFVSRAGLGLLVIAMLLWRYDARPVLRTLAHEESEYFIAAIAIYVAGQVMSSWRWQILAAVVGAHARWREFLAYYFVGIFTNLFVPGLVGGDAARAIYLGRRTGRTGAAIASVIADRGIGLIALFWLAAAMAATFRSALPPSVIRSTLIIGIVTVAAFVASPFIATVVPRLPRPLRRGSEPVLPYLRRPLSTAPAIALSLVLQVSLAIAQWMLAQGLGLSKPMALFLLVVPLANVIASIPITLNGLGLRESAYLVLLGMGGVGRNDAIALGLLWFATTMLGGLTGAIAFAFTKFPGKLQQPV